MSRKEYSYTAPTTQVGTPTSTFTYTYGDSTWKDLLTSYNGESIVYDAVGNPTTYRGKAFTWDNNIRKPITMQTDGGSLEFAYDATGARREKTATFIGADVSHFYHYDGGILLYEVISTQTPLDETPTVEIIEYIYDETGSPVGMIYDGIEYYFVKNLQGDIQRIYTANGTLVGEYHYNAWGNILNESSLSEIAQINPFRYRGYYYDSESGLYYLNSRYYDPEVGRFINSDDPAYLGADGIVTGYNLFAYCQNNLVNGFDPTGHWNWGGFFVGVAIATVGIITIAATLTTGGAAAPLAVGAVKLAAVAVGVSLTETGVVTSYAAAAEKTMVMDLSITDGSTHDKTGYSVVVDFDTDSVGIETYNHYGKTTDGYGVTYGVGLVTGYENPGDYGGYFADAGGSYSHNGVNYGFDVCTDPENPFTKCSAFSVTVGVGIPGPKARAISGYCGIDYYWPVAYMEW